MLLVNLLFLYFLRDVSLYLRLGASVVVVKPCSIIQVSAKTLKQDHWKSSQEIKVKVFCHLLVTNEQ